MRFEDFEGCFFTFNFDDVYVEIAFPKSRDNLVRFTFYNFMTEETVFEKM